MYKTSNVDDTELIYSLLKEKYPTKQINIDFDYNTKEYTLTVTNEIHIKDPNVPVDVSIKVHYGDSITGDTPILLRKHGRIFLKTVQTIFDDSKMYEYPHLKLFDKTIKLEKQYSTAADYHIWSDKGWVNIKKVIRHKTDKKIYKMLTQSGCVHVTEDHSLIREDGNIIKPSQCTKETKLLTCYPFEFDFISEVNNLSNDKAFIYGFFYRNGECHDSQWVIEHKDLNALYKFKTLIQKEYPDNTLLINHNKLTINNDTSQSPDDFLQEYKNNFYDFDSNLKQNPNKKVPIEILNSNIDKIHSFLQGYMYMNNTENESYFDIKGQIGACGLFFLLKRIGYHVIIDENIKDIYRLTFTYSKSFYHKINTIKKIQIDSHNDYVYDIETSCGTFQAGIGDIIVSNTDSIFLGIKYNRNDYTQNRIDTFKLATLCGDKLTHDIFNRHPIEMEFEKVFHPFILLSKKRYIGRKYDNIKDPFEMTKLVTSGIALTRRDYCKMVKKCYKSILDIIMEMKDNDISVINKAINIYKEYIVNIIDYKIPFDDLIVSALLAKSYKTRPVHFILAEKLKNRNEDVQIGERIPYIYIEDTSGLNKIKSELGEDPEYAKKHNLNYNRICYLEQLTKPILSFFGIILKDDSESFNDLLCYVNDKMISIGGKKFKPSDFKLFNDREEI